MPVGTPRDPYTGPKEAERRGGGARDSGPGRTGLPSAQMMDRPPTPCGAFNRTGSSRGSYDAGQRKIQDANRG